MPDTSSPSVRALVHLYSPGYLISALAALSTLHPGAAVAATVIVHLPGAAARDQDEMLAIVRELSAGHPSIRRVEGFRDAEQSGLDARGLRTWLGPDFDEFLYSHDFIGKVCGRLAHAYPRARKVCIGDAFGMVYEADFIARYQGPLPVRARAVRLVKRAAQALGLLHESGTLKPDLAALVLPVDPSGEALRNVPLAVCRAEDFRAALRHCHASAQGLRAYMKEILLAHAGRRCYLLLTETFVEAGHVSAAAEAAMYGEIVRAHCARDGVVFVKLHPQQAAGTAARLRTQLEGSYEIVETDERFRRYPIEIWDEMLRECTVLAMAYPVLSLKYAHGINAVQPMDDAFIERWIEPAHRAWMHDSLRVYMAPLARLGAWDGRGVLWGGAVETR